MTFYPETPSQIKQRLKENIKHLENCEKGNHEIEERRWWECKWCDTPLKKMVILKVPSDEPAEMENRF